MAGLRDRKQKLWTPLTRQFQLSIEAFAGEARNLALPYGTLDRPSLVRRFSTESSQLLICEIKKEDEENVASFAELLLIKIDTRRFPSAWSIAMIDNDQI